VNREPCYITDGPQYDDEDMKPEKWFTDHLAFNQLMDKQIKESLPDHLKTKE
jgi:hypothetical protein